MSEPVAWIDRHELTQIGRDGFEPTVSRAPVSEHDVPLYTRPIEITDAMIRAAIRAAFASGGGTAEGIARAALEAALAAREGA